MTDVLNPDQRRLNMSRVRSKDTRPEMLLRRGLHSRGFRFRLHRRDLPGTPDLVFVALRAVIFVHGCFWHGHGCRKSMLPTTRTEFWSSKIQANQVRDQLALQRLHSAGWRTLVVWECRIARNKDSAEEVLEEVSDWLDTLDRRNFHAEN